MTVEWETPQELFDELDREFHFELDVCATEQNAKCKRYFSPEVDGLSQKWFGVCWMNPPYGQQTGKWIKKAYESAQDGATVVCLIASRTDTRWWHDYVMKGEIRFLRGRVRFRSVDKKIGSPPFASTVVIFRPRAGDDRQAERTGQEVLKI